MTLGQFAYALGVPPKWVQNTWALLGLDAPYGEPELWRMALVRVLEEALQVPLRTAYALAQATDLVSPGRERDELHLVHRDGLELSLHWPRFASGVLAGMSRARTQYQERRRGRPATEPPHGVAAARAQGLDVGLLRASLRRSPAERLRSLDEDLAFLQRLRVLR